MSESPFASAPLDPREKPILQSLLEVRDKLLLLKQDKSTYVKSQDILPIYEDVIAQVHKINEVRTADHRLEENRLDTVLDDCFQLISLFFMAIGRNLEPPAVYAFSSTMIRLLLHLKEAAFYSTKDLESIEKSIDKMKEIADRGRHNYAGDMMQRLDTRIEVCANRLAELKEFLSNLAPETVPTWEKLVSILRSTAALNARSKFSQKDLDDFRKQLLEIKNTMRDGSIPAEDGAVHSGQDRVVPLLERCLLWCDIVEEK